MNKEQARALRRGDMVEWTTSLGLYRFTAKVVRAQTAADIQRRGSMGVSDIGMVYVDRGGGGWVHAEWLTKIEVPTSLDRFDLERWLDA